MTSFLKAILFLIGSGGIAWFSRKSLCAPRAHGFYRFFAWECLLALFLWNAEWWFVDPFSWHQMVAWLLLAVSAFLALHGIYLLRIAGKPDDQRAETPLIGIEKTTQLVTDGAYKYIRHPLYSSLLFLGAGIFFKHPSWLAGGLLAAITVFLVMTARVEEAENCRYFGAAYREYMKGTKMFVPFLF